MNPYNIWLALWKEWHNHVWNFWHTILDPHHIPTAANDETVE